MFTKTIAKVSLSALIAISGALCANEAAAQVPGELGVKLLDADRDTMPIEYGGWQRMKLEAGPELAGKYYLVLGSVSGTTPGIDVLGLHIPLNWDFYTAFTLFRPNAGLIQNQLARLDHTGHAQPAFWVPAGLPRELVGLKVSHCALVFGDFGNVVRVSNPVSLTLVE